MFPPEALFAIIVGASPVANAPPVPPVCACSWLLRWKIAFWSAAAPAAFASSSSLISFVTSRTWLPVSSFQEPIARSGSASTSAFLFANCWYRSGVKSLVATVSVRSGCTPTDQASVPSRLVFPSALNVAPPFLRCCARISANGCGSGVISGSPLMACIFSRVSCTCLGVAN